MDTITESQLNAILDEGILSASALIEHDGQRGIAIKLGETLSKTWRSGDVIVFWANGEHTVPPDTMQLVSELDLFDTGVALQ